MQKEIETLLNNQIKLEGTASMQYLSMASWAEENGFNGIAAFFYKQAEEERMHMVKLIKFVNERGGKAIIPVLDNIPDKFDSVDHLFSTFLESEQKVTNHVNEIVFQCLELKNYTVHNFMQWYVAEQLEEETLARTILDKLNIIGNDKGGLYLFDKDLETFEIEQEEN
ncbi:ferritin [Leptobacterium flavescens]|uniref:Ferritin n=1 Tax=Leptobacterium flavescens TaxID=472055 RepID=A0A6P0UKY6_9FLAO|nr:ferritin [Leptobacterium flavescens]NER13080.1 ferritin [Leptobacterium flavescens]